MDNSNISEKINMEENITLSSGDYNSKGILLFNKGSLSSLTEAVKLFEKATEMGNKDSEYNLSVTYNQMGHSYYYGNNGFPVDYKKAEEYFKKAYDLGLSLSGANLATLYNQLGGVYSSDKKREADHQKAEKYYTLAMEYGSKTAKENLLNEYIELFFDYKFGKKGYICDPKKSKEMLYKAKQLDSTYVIEKAKEYFDKGMRLMKKGITHNNYREIKVNFNKASSLGIVGVNNELIEFYKYVGLCYKKGKKGFKKDKEKANFYLKHASDLGDKESRIIYEESKGKGIYS